MECSMKRWRSSVLCFIRMGVSLVVLSCDEGDGNSNSVPDAGDLDTGMDSDADSDSDGDIGQLIKNTLKIE